MFTGIVQGIGKIDSVKKCDKSIKLAVTAGSFLDGTSVGDSISINGVCLTVTSVDNKIFNADVVLETINKTNLKYLSVGDSVNLEKAMSTSSRFDGHIVQGHIEGTGSVAKIIKEEENFIVKIKISDDLLKYCIHKGSIAINGVSLTIARIEENIIDIWIIPHTLSHTTFGLISTSDIVNIETDIIAKYVEKMLIKQK